MLSDPGEWCDLCNASSVWCPAFLEAEGYTSSGSSVYYSGNMTPQVAGVIGAAVTLGLVLVAFLVLIFLAGLRFSFIRPLRSKLGGFKGSAKLASDADLAAAGKAKSSNTVVDQAEVKPRVGSWELKDKDVEVGKFGSLANATAPADRGARRPSFEEDDDLDLGKKPTVPEERV